MLTVSRQVWRVRDGPHSLWRECSRLTGDDPRRDPLEVRKATLASVLAKAGPASGSMNISKAMATIFRHACKMGCDCQRLAAGRPELNHIQCPERTAIPELVCSHAI